MFKNFKTGALCLFALILFTGFNAQETAVFAEPAPLPPAESVQAQDSGKVKLKAPINNELSEEEKLKAEEEARLKEEMANERREFGETVPMKVEDKDFNPNSNEDLTKEVVPDTSSEIAKLVSMFAKVMLAVILASFIIYFLLVFTGKFFHPPLPSKGEEDFDVRDLNSPKNTDEALKSFLDRTGE